MKYLFVLLILVVCSAAQPAQARILSPESVTLHATVDTDTIVTLKKQSLSLGITYSSDVWFFGRTGPLKYPFISTDAVYNTKFGLYVYGSEVSVLGYNPAIDEIDFGAGYLFKYSKKLSGNISYSKFLFNRDAAVIIKSASSNNLDFKNSFDYKIAKSSIAVDYLFGKSSDIFITFSTSKYIESSFGIFDDKDYLTVNPTISAIFGTQNFVERFSIDHQYLLEVQDIYTPRNGDPAPKYENGRFNALNYSFKLPIAYNRPHYTFEASWRYSAPVNVEYQLKNRHEVFFNLTFYYLFYK